MILAQAFSRFAFDLDGVVWRGANPIPGAVETIASLRDAAKRLCFVTNNSSETPATYAERLRLLGGGGDASEIVTSADATALLLTREVPGLRGRAAFVIGGDGLRAALEPLGLRLVNGEEAADASVVVVGLDRHLTYDKLRLATTAILRGAVFVASNQDATLPTEDGYAPGAGAIVAALCAATGVRPFVAGKPDPTLLAVAQKRLGGTPALMIGDRVDTDIVAAAAAGWPSALVLTGATGLADLAAAKAWPDYLLRRLPELLQDRPHPQVRPAAGPDLPKIATMLHAGGLMSGAARERIGRTIVAEAGRSVVASAAWERFDDVALLRSVAADADERGKGSGTLVVAAALRAIHAAGAREVFLVTENAEAFFASCGFQPIERDDLPDPIAGHPQVIRECPLSAPAMRMRLPQPN